MSENFILSMPQIFIEFILKNILLLHNTIISILFKAKPVKPSRMLCNLDSILRKEIKN